MPGRDQGYKRQRRLRLTREALIDLVRRVNEYRDENPDATWKKTWKNVENKYKSVVGFRQAVLGIEDRLAKHASVPARSRARCDNPDCRTPLRSSKRSGYCDLCLTKMRKMAIGKAKGDDVRPLDPSTSSGLGAQDGQSPPRKSPDKVVEIMVAVAEYRRLHPRATWDEIFENVGVAQERYNRPMSLRRAMLKFDAAAIKQGD